VNGIGKHPSLLQCGNNYDNKNFMEQAPGACTIKHCLAIITTYYCKVTIMSLYNFILQIHGAYSCELLVV